MNERAEKILTADFTWNIMPRKAQSLKIWQGTAMQSYKTKKIKSTQRSLRLKYKFEATQRFDKMLSQLQN